MDQLPLGTLGIGSGWALVALCVILVFRGKLHPQSTIDRMNADHVREMTDLQHDRNEWRTAHRISETARQVAADQVDELLEHARTTDAFIRSLPHPAREGS